MGETARVRRVIDADTIELDQPDPTGTYPFERVRLVRISAPEIGARKRLVSAAAYAGMRYLRALIVRREVEIEGEARDKFHRRLARVRVLLATPEGTPEPHDVETLLVAAGHARWWTDVVRERREAREAAHAER